jgi:23S rRNA (pseudouridine1915-N3)-methyltransferase
VKVQLVAVGKVRGPLAASIQEYEARVRHYFPFQASEVREEPARRQTPAAQVMREEGKRLLARVAPGLEIVALHRGGAAWTSERLSRYLAQLAVQAQPGAAFLIGGAYGLSDEVLGSAQRLLSLSAFTLPHELARLVLAEQLYRAGTIARGEPYHKASATDE